MSRFNDRTGETNLNCQKCQMQIVKYYNALDIDVKFLGHDYIIHHQNYANFKKGLIKNPYFPDVLGVACTGAKYDHREGHEYNDEYVMWISMIHRCYTDRYPTYKDVTCCDEWLNFENFCEWVNQEPNFYKHKNHQIVLCLDKDILYKNNKIYGPNTATLVPQHINMLLIKRNAMRGDLPIGVHKDERYGTYTARCSNSRVPSGGVYLGSYKTPEQAFEAYKAYKEALIKDLAQQEFNKGNITERCYQALMNYEVEITD